MTNINRKTLQDAVDRSTHGSSCSFNHSAYLYLEKIPQSYLRQNPHTSVTLELI